MTKVVEVDGDVLRYRCGYAAQSTVYSAFKEGDLVCEAAGMKALKEALESQGLQPSDVDVFDRVEAEDAANALHSAKLTLERIRDVTKADEVRVHLSSSYNWREDVATLAPYKGNRWSPARVEQERAGRWADWIVKNQDKIKYQPRPVLYPELTEYLTKRWKAKTYKRVEADDAMGIYAYRAFVQGKPGCIATIDKDLDMIPGEHYNFASEEKALYFVEPEIADAKFFQQMLSGDSTDNIPGLPGVGESTAIKLLGDEEGIEARYQRVLGLYAAYYLTGVTDPELMQSRLHVARHHAHEAASLVWIYRNDKEDWAKHFNLDLTVPIKVAEDYEWQNGRVKKRPLPSACATSGSSKTTSPAATVLDSSQSEVSQQQPAGPESQSEEPSTQKPTRRGRKKQSAS